MLLPDEDGRYKIVDVIDIVAVRTTAKQMAGNLGFGMSDQVRLATAVSELARNVVQYVGKGTCTITDLSNDTVRKIVVVIEDHGAGIVDLHKAMQDGFSTSGGLGAGLPGSRRLMDEFHIESQPGLTRITIAIIRPR